MRVSGVLAFTLFMGVGAVVAGQAPQPSTPGQTTQPGQPAPGQPSRTPARPLRPGEAPPKGTAVIRGQVLAAGAGTPVRRAQVRAMSFDGRGGGVTSTNNEGRFEIKELPAGRYNITATKGGYVQGQFGQRRPGDPGTPIDLAEGQAADKVNMTLARGGVISGRVVDDGGEAVSATQVTAVRFQFIGGQRRLVPAPSEGSNDRTDDQGGFRLYGLPPGDYYVSANNRSGAMMMPEMVNNTETEGYAPTYYPGTANMAEASRISIKAGQEMSGANFALIIARMARIKGRALNSRGEPVARQMLMLAPADPSMMMNMGGMNNAMVAPDGSFQFTNVPPGRYNLNVRPMGMPGASDEFAVMPITVGNDDIDNLVISTGVGAIARGVVVTDDGTPPPFRADQVQLFAATADATPMFVSPGNPKVAEDYSFEITGLFDRRLIRASAGASAGWYLKAIMYDGEDVTDRGIEFAPGRTYEGFQVVFSQKTTDLSGLVTDARGKPVLDASVVIFPANRELWTYSSRYVRTARPDTNGRYNIKSLPPGEDYLVIAVQNLESGRGGDPDFLTHAKEEAKSFTLNEGETKAVDVKLSTLVP